MSASLSSPKQAHKHDCVVGVEDSSGNVIPFDIQSAEPGAFTMPGANDIETYEPGSMARATWVYFKGYPREKPTPEHPFEKPFEDLTIFTIDLVRDDDTSKVLRQIMREFSLILCHANTLTHDYSTYSYRCFLDTQHAVRQSGQLLGGHVVTARSIVQVLLLQHIELFLGSL